MNLGEFIDTLERMPLSLEVQFEGGYVPGDFISWRGRYEELSLEPRGSGAQATVRDLLASARRVVGSSLEGYKGGRFSMDRATPLWADSYGSCDYTYPAGVYLSGGRVVIALGVEAS